ncbi:MAG TPA: hypothetical protein VM511_12640 [Luteolibacter sp.]|nr:hypothetical protein [Luteolibacter sp.]
MKTLSLLFALFLPAPLHATTVLIDFGSSSSTNGNGLTTGQPQTWNNVTNYAAHTTGLLKNTAGNDTAITLTLGGAFSNIASEAPKPVSSPYPTTATGDAFFQSTPITLTLNNLNPEETYNITFYGFLSRSTTRNTSVSISDATQSYEASNMRTGGTDAAPTGMTNPNGGSTTFLSVSPDSNGVISMNIAQGSGNTGFYILGVMEITSVPEPSAALLSLLGTVPLLLRRRSAR